MPKLDYEKILHENPSKHLRVMHEKLKENFSEELAKEYSNIYMESPLPFLLENSRYIFSEPLFGFQYYKEQVLNKKNVLECVEHYPEELEKVEAFVEEFAPKMSDEQTKMYESLATDLRNQIDDTRNIRTMLAYEQELPDNHTMCMLTKTPFLLLTENGDGFAVEQFTKELTRLCSTESTNPEDWKQVFEAVVTCGKLMEDSVFVSVLQESVVPKDFRYLVQALAEESVGKQIQSIYQVQKAPEYIREYGSPCNAVENIFNLEYESQDYEELYAMEREETNSLCGFAYDLLSGIASFEYTLSEDTASEFHGFRGVFTETTSVEDAFRYLAEQSDVYNEAKKADREPGHIPNALRDSVSDYGEEEPSKKPKPPSDTSAARKIQRKWMDKESNYYKKAAKAKAAGEEIKGAAKAVSAIPMHIKRNIDDAVEEWDEMDDDRRRKYLIKPGFRKKIFRNLKLALMYGATTSISVLLLPVTMIARHYSKQKDRRIRNQLAKELETEIEICKEKINDASSQGDNKQKYQLMRIKSKLEQERARVLFNSKYI